MTNLLTRIEQLAGADVAQAIQAEFGGLQVYIPGDANPATPSSNAPQPAAIHAQRVDGIATHILALVEAVAPATSSEADLGPEALLAALIRRTGPYGYSLLTEWIPVSRA